MFKHFAVVLALRKVTYADHRSGKGGIQLSLELPWPGRLHGRTFSVALWTWDVGPAPERNSVRRIFDEADRHRERVREEGRVMLRSELLRDDDDDS